MSEAKIKASADDRAPALDLSAEAKLALKFEIQRRGLTYKQVYEMMRERGWKESYSSVNQRIARGNYKMTFFMAVMSCIGVKEVSIRIPENVYFSCDENEIEITE